MATIITKNSQTASAVPSAASLQVGELAVNTADGKLYTEHTGGVVKEIIPSTVVDGGITPAKLSTGAPNWDAGGDLTVTGSNLNVTAVKTQQNNGGGVLFDGTTNYHIFRPSGINALYYDSLQTNEHVFRGAMGNNAIISTNSGQIHYTRGAVHATAYFSDASGLIASFNISSYSKNSNGDYQMNFTRNAVSANWSLVAACNWQTGGGNNANSTQVITRSTSAARVFTGSPHISGVTGQSQLPSLGTMIAIFDQY